MRAISGMCIIRYLIGLLLSYPTIVYGQIDTTGFPFHVGNRWYYRFASSITPPPYVRVKTIVDTTQTGAFVVHVRALHDTTILATETWIVQNGAMYLNQLSGLPIYNPALTHDTTWITGNHTYAYQLGRVTLFGSDSKSQIYSDHNLGNSYYEYDVAVGIGIYFDDHWAVFPGLIEETSTLIGLVLNGQLFGDTVLTSVPNPNPLEPDGFWLAQNYPNPFNPSTTIEFSIPRASNVFITIFDLVGQKMSDLLSQPLGSGTHRIQWNADGIPSGVYFYQLRAADRLQTRKLVVIK